MQKLVHQAIRLPLALLLCSALLPAAPRSAAQQPASVPDATLRAAVCPIVYPNDQTPGNKGIHYTFFGNAFFINSRGYLVTAAHVMQTFRDGGQPYILVDRPNAPPETVKANIIGIDWTHDVAVLRAVPNPFEGKFRVAFLPLASKRVVSGDAIISTALHPENIRSAYTYQMPVQDWSRAEVLDYVQTHEEIQLPQTDLFIFSHEVQKGQSGAPVLLSATREVAGLVDGRWLRPTAVSPANKNSQKYSGPMGAAVPIDYMIELLQKYSVSWTSAPQTPPRAAKSPANPVK
jgi:S1-C subfamily serine protease